MIGVFDSGLGGLTILKYFLRDLPGYDYIYLGDNARMPYGDKSQEEIYKYTKQAVDFLFSKGAKLIVLACNTASSQALRKIQQEYLPKKYPGKKVLGVVIPLAEAAARDNIKRVGVLGTRATIKSGVYKKELKKINPKIEVLEQSAPLLVPLIEEGWVKNKETEKILKKYLAPFIKAKINALILGCTHYPVLIEEIKDILNKDCLVYNPGEVIACSLKDYLQRHKELGIKSRENAVIEYYTTGEVEKFIELGNNLINNQIKKARKANL